MLSFPFCIIFFPPFPTLAFCRIVFSSFVYGRAIQVHIYVFYCNKRLKASLPFFVGIVRASYAPRLFQKAAFTSYPDLLDLIWPPPPLLPRSSKGRLQWARYEEERGNKKALFWEIYVRRRQVLNNYSKKEEEAIKKAFFLFGNIRESPPPRTKK